MLWSIFSVIPSFQIKGRFAFQLTKSSGGPRQRANIVKSLSRSICVMAELPVIGPCTCVCACLCMHVHWPPSSSVVPSTAHLSVPVIMAEFYFELTCHCFVIVRRCSWQVVPSKITGWSCCFPASISPCPMLCSPHITMETTRFLSPPRIY